MIKDARKSEGLPTLVFAEAILPTRSGKRLYDAPFISGRNVREFYTDPDVVEKAKERLERIGFQVWHIQPGQARPGTRADIDKGNLPTLSIAAPPDLFRETLKKVELDTLEVEQVGFGQQRQQSTHLSFRDRESGDEVHGALADAVEGIAIALAAPTRLFALPPTLPSPGYFYLRLPEDLAAQLEAKAAHADGFTGNGIRVAMVDTGHYWHPFFDAQGYRREGVILTTTATAPDRDDHGHGTGESANLYAVAPQVTLIPVKAPLAGIWEGRITDSLIAATQAFKVAASLDPPPHIITCSWGYDLATRNDFARYDAQALAMAAADAVYRDIVVVFSAGNGDYGFPAQHPDVIAAGGAYITEDGKLQASDYASAFYSHIYNDSTHRRRLRRVPDVCGLVGMAQQFGRYLMLPVPPGSKIDEDRSKAGDGTGTGDGWAVFSGTSAAAPQVAGVIALLLQANPALTPGEVKQILQETARDVPSGKSAPVGGRRAQAHPGPDVATGAGLVDAAAAVKRARDWHPD